MALENEHSAFGIYRCGLPIIRALYCASAEEDHSFGEEPFVICATTGKGHPLQPPFREAWRVGADGSYLTAFDSYLTPWSARYCASEWAMAMCLLPPISSSGNNRAGRRDGVGTSSEGPSKIDTSGSRSHRDDSNQPQPCWATSYPLKEPPRRRQAKRTCACHSSLESGRRTIRAKPAPVLAPNQRASFP